MIKRIVVALGLSAVAPGLAHAIAGRRRGAVLWSLSSLVVLGAIGSIWFLWIACALHIACAVDAVRVYGRPVTPSEPIPSAAVRALATPLGRGVFIAIPIVVISIAGGAFVSVAAAFRIPTSSMTPTLQIGDHLLVESLTLRWRAPERGDLVTFREPCVGSEYVKRVVAVAGDTVEIRCSKLYINGVAVREELVEADCHYDDFDLANERWASRRCSRYRETLDDRGYDTLQPADRTAAPDAQDFPQLDGRAPSCPPGRNAIVAQPAGTIVRTRPPDGAACEPQIHYVVPPETIFALGDNRPNSNDSRYWGPVPLASVHARVVGVWYGRSLGRIGNAR